LAILKYSPCATSGYFVLYSFSEVGESYDIIIVRKPRLGNAGVTAEAMRQAQSESPELCVA